ncbi:MAG: ribonuclease III [Pseudomonadota bacterium]|nr:ribonuclease III [Pseudomonadota bacterium]
MQPLEQRIGYRFRDGGLLKLALTHPSLGRQQSNQRLEFLGDAVLGMAVARMLYEIYPNDQEGELASRRAALVSGGTLAEVARGIGLGEALHVGASEAQSGGRGNASNLEDALEALIGALYLDGGVEAAQAFIAQHWTPLARKAQIPPKDAKTALQEWAQGRGLPLPAYTLVETTGPAHAPEFTVEAAVQGFPPARAKAASKRAAEQLAAGELLERLQHG